MDNLIICSKCKSDACYVEEINQDIKTYFCYGCGFQSNSLMKENSEFINQQTETLPELYKDLFFKDKNGMIWVPSVINLPQQGMIFANGTNSNEWKWSAVKAVPITEEEKTKYPIPGKEGQFYEWRMDMTTISHFDERGFIDALSYIGVLPE